jgi:opacity protein-like surface antigen
MKCRVLAGIVCGMLLLCASGARADEEKKQEASAQGFGFFTKDSTGQGRRDTSTNGGGFLLGYRYHFNRWIAADVSYGRTRDTNKTLSTFPVIPVVLGPGPRVLPTTFRVQSDIHETTAAFVVTIPSFGRLHPYVLAGAGALTFVPTQNVGGFFPGAGNQSKSTIVYGGGADYDFTRHFAFRLEYRGFVYTRPDFGQATLGTGATTNTAQPSAGIVFRF